MSKTEIHELVTEAVTLLNAQLPEEQQLGTAPDTILYGMDSVLDSFDLVALIVQLEQKLQDSFSVSFTLANDKALSMKRSPFSTIATLTSYIEQLLQEAKVYA